MYSTGYFRAPESIFFIVIKQIGSNTSDKDLLSMRLHGVYKEMVSQRCKEQCQERRNQRRKDEKLTMRRMEG